MLFGQSMPYGAPAAFGPQTGVDPSLLVLAGYNLYILGIVIVIALFLLVSVIPFFAVLFLCEFALKILSETGIQFFKYLLIMFRGLRRSPLRTALSYLALFVLTVVLTLIYAVLHLLSNVTTEKEANFKVIITERYSIPSQMPPSHLETLKRMIAKLPPDLRPVNGDDDIMSWSFTGGTTDPTNPRPENMLFMFSMEPRKILTMMDGFEPSNLTADELKMMQGYVKQMEEDPRRILVSKVRMEKMGLTVGQRIKLYGWGFNDVVFDFEVIGMPPDGKYEGAGFMNNAYLFSQIKAYERLKGTRSPLADKCINLIWVKVPNKEAYQRLSALCNDPKNFSPAVKLETASAGIGSWLEAYKDILFGMKYLMAPCMLAIMSLVVANAISISVRERRTELAVLKVLGFRPWHVMGLVLGEALLIGFFAGFLAVGLVYFGLGNFKFQVAFFGAFVIPPETLIYGPMLGMAVATAGSFLPALSARNVKVSEVFSRVA
ncbi:MAG TPA: ABC transporter permease [Fimbriiglobus sp.]|jgi:putative ABC transport system permease protein